MVPVTDPRVLFYSAPATASQIALLKYLLSVAVVVVASKEIYLHHGRVTLWREAYWSCVRNSGYIWKPLHGHCLSERGMALCTQTAFEPDATIEITVDLTVRQTEDLGAGDLVSPGALDL